MSRSFGALRCADSSMEVVIATEDVVADRECVVECARDNKQKNHGRK